MERLSDSPDYGFPPKGELGYLIGYLLEIGEGQSTGNGIVPIDWCGLKAWTDLTGVDLLPVEALAIMRLSRAYVDQFYASEGVDIGPPKLAEDENRQEKVAEKLRLFFSMLKEAKRD